MKSLQELIETVAETRHRGDGSAYRSLSFADQQRIAEQTGRTAQDVQLTALAGNIVPEVYARNQRSLSAAEQARLLASHVAIIGLGGLGGAVCDLCARIGIGRLTLVDGDRFVDSNLNRQLLSTTDALGRYKADVAVARVAAVNPAVAARGITRFLTAENGEELLAGAHIVVDCLDSISARLLVERLCEQRALPLVSAAIGGTSGQAIVVKPGDRLLSRIYGSSAGRSVGVEGRLGTLPYAAVALAAVECAEVVALALGRPAALLGRLLFTDLADHSSQLIDLPGEPGHCCCKPD